jgi:small ligand-binding sensory domain FIST
VRWASAVSILPATDVAMAEVCDAVETQLDGSEADLVLVFMSPHHRAGWEAAAVDLAERFASATIIGCSAGGVIGAGSEVEAAPGLSLVAAHLPDVEVISFALDNPEIPLAERAPAFWSERTGLDPAQDPTFLLLPDPFTCDGSTLIEGLDLAFPGQVKLGGMASGGSAPGSHRLLLDGKVRRSGVVGVALVGDLQVDTVVAQGGRAIGSVMVVTAAQGSSLISLDGLPAMAQLQRVFATLDEADRERLQAGPMLGLAPHPGSREYLLRQITGVDRVSGVLRLGAQLQVGQEVRFHLLDPEAARQVLERGLSACAEEPSGALIFSCSGRGARFFGLSDHDTDLFHSRIGGAPLGGFFCSAEIAPMHGRTWMHGYTSAIGMFRPRGWD